jgi:sorting nexin-1/2
METESPKPKAIPANLTASNIPRSSASRNPRTPRTPRRVELQPTRLDALDDADPLGPLGASAPVFAGPPPAPPIKEHSLPSRTRQVPQERAGNSGLRPEDMGDEGVGSGDRLRHPPPVPPLGAEQARRQGQPSVSIEQAAKPSFDITVGDPHKVGDLTSSHIVYQVRTKVYYKRHAI